MTRFNLKLAALIFLPALAALFFGKNIQIAASDYVFGKLKKAQTLGFFPLNYGFIAGRAGSVEMAGENQKLARRIEDLEARLSVADFQSKREESPAGAVSAGIIMRPPGLVYDQLIVDKGAADGVSAGNIVLAGKDIILGYIEEVLISTSRVILISSFGREQNLFLEKAGSAALVAGKSSGEFEATLSRDFPVETGERLLTLTEPPYLAGIVEKIESSPSSPVKKLKIRQPFNLNNLHSINILIWPKK